MVSQYPITKQQDAVIRAAAGIMDDPVSPEDFAFLARHLVQCTLPHRSPGNVPVWSRRNGNVVLGIQPGVDVESGQSLGYPYGSIPRLVLYWMTTEACRQRQRRLELGHSLASYMRALGLDPSRGGKRSDATRLRGQLERLFGCRISFQQSLTEPGRQGTQWLHMEVAPRGELWWNPKQPEQGTLWGSWIELGEEFYQAITTAPVPLDMRALRAIKRSPLALDLYAWCAYNAYRANKSGRTIWTTWDKLAKALGSEYGRETDFQQKVRRELRKVSAVFPGLRLGTKRGCLEILSTSTPPVAEALSVEKS